MRFCYFLFLTENSYSSAFPRWSSSEFTWDFEGTLVRLKGIVHPKMKMMSLSFQTCKTSVHLRDKKHIEDWHGREKKCLIMFFFSLCTKMVLVVSFSYGWPADVTWTILTMSLLPFWALNVVVVLLSMEGQKALGFHPKYLNLCSDDEGRSYGFGTTWVWVIDDIIFIFGGTSPWI